MQPLQRKKALFLSDLDGTWLSKNPEFRTRLDEGVVQLKDEFAARGVDLEFGYVTARPPVRVEQEHLPRPDWTITYNGGLVHRGEAGHREGSGNFVVHPDDPAWHAHNQTSHFQAQDCKRIVLNLLARPDYQNLQMQTTGQVVENPAADANPFGAGFCFPQASIRLTAEEQRDTDANGTPDLFEKSSFAAPAQMQHLVADLDRELQGSGAEYQLSPVYPFSGKPLVMFNAAARHANKGEAVAHVAGVLHVPPEHLIVAGDGGNDLPMMTGLQGEDDGRRVIVVGGEKDLVEAAGKLRRSIVQPASLDCSLGVLDGLRRHLEEIAGESPG